MKNLILAALTLCASQLVTAQSEIPDTTNIFQLEEITVTANRLPIGLKSNPGAISVVTRAELSLMPKTIGVEEALWLVPGVRIDNQHDGERVHVSIRGQGILTERGLRGIGVVLDGIPVNDPSGFAPDLYDVDWATVNHIEVIRGPVAGLYGGGGAAGVLLISTADGGPAPSGADAGQSLGSNGFRKSFVQAGGSGDGTDYRVSFSRTDGDGYRDHQAYWSNKLYEKLHLRPVPGLSLTQIVSHTDYFQQNPEGLNLGQFDNLRQANPDARPFNEYQKTNRTTVGAHAVLLLNTLHDVEWTAFLREWKYKETSNRYAEYRDVRNPGGGAQYNLHLSTGSVRHDVSVGSDLKWQEIGMDKLQSAADPFRAESTDETNIETDSLLADQVIDQRSAGIFLLYKLAAGGFNLMGNLRREYMDNGLTDKLVPGLPEKTDEDFSKTSGRVGASYGFNDAVNVFANWSQGFMPPSTEELAANPTGYSGFNTHLVPATSDCYDIGVRGNIGGEIVYDVSGFIMDTENDFFRFKQTGRGNQEVFYGNAGNSRRYGVESSLSVKIRDGLRWETAYTFSDFRYTSATIDHVYTDTAYVLTVPPAAGQWLPNSPRHQLRTEIVYSVIEALTLSAGAESQSRWAIYTDAKAYGSELDPAIYRNWQDGFTLFNAGLAYAWGLGRLRGELSIFARNFTGVRYMAFTEPDPDGNAYQPGPGREYIGKINIGI
jgi:iron complex outermembrane receptor protein